MHLTRINRSYVMLTERCTTLHYMIKLLSVARLPFSNIYFTNLQNFYLFIDLKMNTKLFFINTTRKLFLMNVDFYIGVSVLTDPFFLVNVDPKLILKKPTNWKYQLTDKSILTKESWPS